MKSFILSIMLTVFFAGSAFSREKYNFNSDWKMTTTSADNLHKAKNKRVTLPHAWNEDDAYRISSYEFTSDVVWYRKEFRLPASAFADKKVFIEFEGGKQALEVWLNKQFVGRSENGVMAFGFDITPYLKKGKNFIEVKTDNAFNYKEQSTGSTYQWNSKSFFANYGGITKNVFLHITDKVYQTLPLYSNLGTTGTYVYAKNISVADNSATIHVESQVRNETSVSVQRQMLVLIEELDGREVARFSSRPVTIPANGTTTISAEQQVGGLQFWSWGYGYLYNVKTILAEDCVTTTTGFRKTEFRQGKIYLNDRVLMMHGFAQRSTNEWPCVGSCVPAWLSDYSNDLFVKCGGNIVRWMHVTPSKQDIESCDRVGLLQAMPAGDSEKDAKGRWWTQRLELMRDAIIYNRNNPSIIFYECGNSRISQQHMVEMRQLRNQYDPEGGRAIGCREMLNIGEAEYGGEMLYVNKSAGKPMWMMEYSRDEAHRMHWNSWSYPYHQEGDGPLLRGKSASAYNHNQDEFAAEMVRRWYEYWQERPGQGTRCNSGGAKIIFSDSQTHGRSSDNYRVSGCVDPMRIPKDAYFVHQVMWDGWVDDLTPRTYIVGHWNYAKANANANANAKVPPLPRIYVVSNADSVVLFQNGKPLQATSHEYHFLWTFTDVVYESDTLLAIGYDKQGREESRYQLETAGEPHHILLTAIENPTGWKADGADLEMVQVEIVDKDGRRCPLDNRLIHFSLEGPAEWRGGIARNKHVSNTNQYALTDRDVPRETNPLAYTDMHLNHVLCDTLPVECGINRVMLRSLTTAGAVTLVARAEGMPEARLSLQTNSFEVTDGLAVELPSKGLLPRLDGGATPQTPSFTQSFVGVSILEAKAPVAKKQKSIETIGTQTDTSWNPCMSYDDNEITSWVSSTNLDSAWVSYTLVEKAQIKEIAIKFNGFRTTTYPVAVYATTDAGHEQEVWRGQSEKGLGYFRIRLKDAPLSDKYTIRLVGSTTTADAFGQVKELDSKNDDIPNAKANAKAKATLQIKEIEFLK